MAGQKTSEKNNGGGRRGNRGRKCHGYRYMRRSSGYASNESPGCGYAQDAGAEDVRPESLPRCGDCDFRLRFLVAQDGYLPTWNEVDKFLSNIDGVTRLKCDPTGINYRYYNEATRAEAWFRGYRPQVEGDFGLVFELPLPRPECLAHEVLPLAVQVARAFGFCVQLLSGEERTVWENVSDQQLLPVWEEACVRARKLWSEEHGPVPVIKCCDAGSAWEYILLKEFIDNRYRRSSCRALDVEFVRRRRTGEVLRLCRWHGLAPVVFPPVDLILLEKPPKPLRTGKIINAAEFFEQGRHWVKTDVVPITHKLYPDEEIDPEFLEFVNGLKGTTMRSYEEVRLEDLDDSAH